MIYCKLTLIQQNYYMLEALLYIDDKNQRNVPSAIYAVSIHRINAGVPLFWSHIDGGIVI